MRSIGIRELRQQATRYLRLVESGESVQITDRGRPIAMLVPCANGSVVEELETQGRLSRPATDLLDLGPPLAPARGVPLPSETLRRARNGER